MERRLFYEWTKERRDCRAASENHRHIGSVKAAGDSADSVGNRICSHSDGDYYCYPGAACNMDFKLLGTEVKA